VTIVSRTLRVLISHIITALSKLPVAIALLSGLNATALMTLACPVKVARSLPVATSHTFAVISWAPLTMLLPSPLNATEVTFARCPRNVLSNLPVMGSMSRTLVLHAQPQSSDEFERWARSERMKMRIASSPLLSGPFGSLLLRPSRAVRERLNSFAKSVSVEFGEIMSFPFVCIGRANPPSGLMTPRWTKQTQQTNSTKHFKFFSDHYAIVLPIGIPGEQ